MHLKPNICLQKVKVMDKNGRPMRADYFYDGQKICEIKFEFEVDQLNFMTRRTEKLGYVNGAGATPEHYAIYDQTFSVMVPSQFGEMIKERAQARAIIFDEVKAIVSAVITQAYMSQGMTYPEVLQIAGAFWERYSAIIDSWVNTGTPELRTQIEADQITPFIDFILPAALTGEPENMTIRAYVIERITY